MITPAGALLNCLNRPPWQWLQFWTVLAAAVIIWAAVGLGPYSGFHSPPMYGDFEAQRHWMEITQYLPASQWYHYDLEWWGLDYPPLTAYHSWIIGHLGSLFDKRWFALDVSRGLEDPALKNFMRNTVIVNLLAVWVPAVAFYQSFLPVLKRSEVIGIIFMLPSLILIDCGHFQYNGVMLGLSVASLDFLQRRRFVWASIAFVAALFFKQMTLYYAPAIFVIILGNCIRPLRLGRLFAVGTTVICMSLLLISPFLDLDELNQVLFRVFPFARGLWEDKVANLWCTLNTAIKLRQVFTQTELQQLALGATMIAILPSCIIGLVKAKNSKVIPWVFGSCAWAFFLFSFQVHEKSVLLPLVPTTFTLFQGPQPLVLWINNIAYYSMWPLLKREGLSYQYFVVLALWNWLFAAWRQLPKLWLHRLVVLGSYAAIVVLAVTEYADLVPILSKYPDIWVVLNCTLSFACFSYFWLWQTIQLGFYM